MKIERVPFVRVPFDIEKARELLEVQTRQARMYNQMFEGQRESVCERDDQTVVTTGVQDRDARVAATCSRRAVRAPAGTGSSPASKAQMLSSVE